MKSTFAIIAILLLLAGDVSRGEMPARRVQEELRKRNLYFGDVDGKMTPELAAATRRYQARKGFQPTGELDQETLASLKLAPAPPQESASEELPPEPVFRSDQARKLSLEDRAALETVAEVQEEELPPPVASAPAEPVAERARAFIQSYLAQAEQNEPSKELQYFGPAVDYFDHGVVEHDYVSEDVRRYYARWPKRDYTLLAPPFVGTIQQEDRVVVSFQMAFIVKNSKKIARGRTEYLFTLDTSGEDEWKIVGIKERRLR